ncbi:hypothetical protein DYB37_007557 [Aphanomyces astaci]|uniref:Uncharacterized protein n=1 Tax=Aphanomyces astaci TaxID=112090 RepID=A0A397A148_APHAT|nr:hypothetical protein DYB36_000825 [Aphanomyces astaci]RHY37797.1 hypothetical protein DYB25_002078 [Aphanomyces astaci]RHY39937.1 hypothetical protein DYB34_003698 [Aphanomyces astaci]RHY40116.1 hypothetical protein DYB38_008246 [Aphanomyces astaci]RHY63070.1 hypothetical protein DYB30_006196 [Aphanomyces astaci]
MPLPKADVPAATSTSKATAAKNKGAEVVGKYLDSINKTDIVRINGYLRFANIGVGFIFGLMGLVGIFSVSGYESFLVQLYVIVLSGLLVLFEFREKFPKLESKTKENFGFMFTGFGRSVYILLYHPQYHSVMRGPSTTTASPDAANPAVEQRVADAAYVPTSAGVAV